MYPKSLQHIELPTTRNQMLQRKIDQLIKEVDLLVIDDYGTSLTQYGISKMFSVANLRTGKITSLQQIMKHRS